MFDLVVGSGNPHKVVELKALLPNSVFQLTCLAEVDSPLDVEETGATFAENARLKATLQAKHLGRWVLAEDSGLVVDALDGRPGVYSARYAGRHGDDAANNRKLLDELAAVPEDKRGAAFCCFVCVAAPDGSVRIETSGTCRGVIGYEPLGSHGFGYDPLFLIPEYHQTFGQLGLAIKSVLSHRSRALRRLVPSLIAVARSECK